MIRRRFLKLPTIAFAIAVLWFVGLLAQERDRLIPKNDGWYTPQNMIKFDHKSHASQACTTCHAAATTSTRSRDVLHPPKSNCTDCHTTQSPTMQDCNACHVGYKVAKSDKPYQHVKPPPMARLTSNSPIRFPHADHVKRLSKTAASKDAVCTTCHDMSGNNTMPSESTCTTCHTAQNAPNDCTTCHVTDPKTKRLKTNLATRTLKPNNHDVDWIKRHAAIAKSMPDNCASCHTEDQCADCHVEQLATPFAVHPPDFLAAHSLSARAEPGTCGDCHNAQTFCLQCHIEADAFTVAPNDPPDRLAFHPADWLEPTAPSNHGVNARRNVVECATCHTEQDCVECHAGVNPHPADFLFSCRQWLDANSQPCLKCHTDLTLLAAMCR